MILDRPVTVLIVDDEEDVCKAYQNYFEREGHRTRVATSGPEALLKADDNVDVVLLDRRMPDFSGDDVLSFIRDWNLDCRVVMVTAVEPDESVIDMEFDGYLTKPVSREKLTETVREQVLFDQYAKLFEQYQSATTKHALLASESNIDDEKLQSLVEQRQQLKRKLQKIVEGFEDETVKQTLSDLHRSS